MERIGLAASKMAKGNIALYNFYVILVSSLFSLFIFVMTGLTVIFSLVIIRFFGDEIVPQQFRESWGSVFSVCMGFLTGLIVLINLFAILKNIKFPKRK